MIPLSILRERLQLPESMTFEDYVRVDDDVQAHEEITEMDIMAELQSGSVNNEQVEEEEEEEEENVAAENVRVFYVFIFCDRYSSTSLYGTSFDKLIYNLFYILC